jgi:hypothetical protein
MATDRAIRVVFEFAAKTFTAVVELAGLGAPIHPLRRRSINEPGPRVSRMRRGIAY